MLLVKHYQSVNGNIKERKFREIKYFNNQEELEKERRRLQKLHKAQIDFTPIIDIGDNKVPEERLKELFI